MAETTNKYLDIAGVRTLWGAIKAADDKLASDLSARGASIAYNEGTHQIVLKNAAGEPLGQGIDATPFIKDGMLEDVEVYTAPEDGVTVDSKHYEAGTKFIKFTWNISKDGESGVKTDYILLSDIATTYKGSESIEISADNTLSVGTVGSAKVDVNSIPVGGTPLAEILLAKGIKTIDAGNLQVVLENLFSVDTPGTGSRIVPTSATLSMDAPSCSLNKALVEVGSQVTLSAATKTASASATVSYTGFEYGYSVADDNTKDADGVPSSVTYAAVQDAAKDYTLSATVNSGFTGANITTATNHATATISQALTTVLGTNKVTVTATAPTFTISIPGQPQYFICSSLEKTSGSVPASEASSINVASVTKTNSASVIAVYPVYTNAVSASVNNTASAEKKVIADSNVFEVTYGPETDAFNMFAYPATHSISKVEIWNPNAGAYGDYTGGSASSTETKTLLSGDKSYSVWTRQGAASAASTKFKFTLNKKTSVE